MQEIEMAAVMVRDPVTIDARRSLGAAHRLMRRHKIRHLPVLRKKTLIGVLSLRDLHLIETLKDVDPEDVPVEEAMSADPYQVSPATLLVEVLRRMVAGKLGSAVVVDEGAIVGLFTKVDGLRLLADLLEGVAVKAPTRGQRRSSPARTSRSDTVSGPG